MMIDIKETLKKELQRKLPGTEAQLLMAPKFRKEELLKRNLNNTVQKSAVLVLFNPFGKELSLVITKRSSRLKVHRGQVSLPGGRVDINDVDCNATALRETYEEIGIPIQDIEIIGQLTNLFIPPTNFDVVPVLGILIKEPQYSINPDEVESVVEVPLSQFIDPQNIKHKIFINSSSGTSRTAPYYDVMGLEIWGATAMIISELICLLPLKDKV